MERLIIITGLSGSGKTLASDCLEDLGYFCVDNLPAGLITSFRELLHRSREPIGHAALVIDAREGAFLDQFPEILADLRRRHEPVELLFFECGDDVLKRRFSESRRPHPMARAGGTLDQALERERQALQPLREIADRIIDTSSFTSHQLRAFLQNTFYVSADSRTLRVNIVSFGFKYGVPPEVDLLFDVRFLPNPYFVDELRPLDGREPAIQEFLERSPTAAEFLVRLQAFLAFLIPHYATEGKSYLTVAFGCTGGRHRSVAVAEQVGRYLVTLSVPKSVSHRDLGRE